MKNTLLIVGFMLLTIALLFFINEFKFAKGELIEVRADNKELKLSLYKEQKDKSSCIYTKDSLNQLVIHLSKYRTLTDAMVARDEAVKLLKHKTGDIVYLKRDSSKVVITDVVLGGGRYNYYVRFKVSSPSEKEIEISPELIY
jgi:hypothetical protein